MLSSGTIYRENERTNELEVSIIIGYDLLSLSQLTDTNRHHVFQDLRPYICTFPDCSDPERLFFTRHDWIYHEMQMHRRKWSCQSCHCEYFSKLEVVEHFERVHNSSKSDSERKALIESERPVDQGHVAQCPFCHRRMGTEELLDHMAGHMEELALSSLPRSHEDTRETEDAMSHVARTPQPDGLPNPRIPSLSSSSQSSYRPAPSQPHTRQPKSSRGEANSVNSSASKQQYRTEPHHLKRNDRLATVVYCVSFLAL